MRLSILSNVNLDMLSGLLKKENEVFQTDGYGEWITYALKRTSVWRRLRRNVCFYCWMEMPC